MNLRSPSHATRVGVLVCALAVVIPLGDSAPGVAALSSPATSQRAASGGGVATVTSDSSPSKRSAARQATAGTPQLAAATGACRDGAYRQQGHAWKASLKWGYQTSSTPSRMRPSAAVEQIRRANENVREAQDDCGLKGRPAVSARYLGGVRTSPNMFLRDGVVKCGQPNGRSTVGWGQLPGNLIGVTCYWWNARQNMVEADIRFDPGQRIALRDRKSCTGKVDLQSIATHEWGHAYGLQHPGRGHARLTMAHLLPNCTKAPRSLGLGDWRGMRKLYGLR